MPMLAAFNMGGDILKEVSVTVVAGAALLLMPELPASPHGIYTGVRGKNGALCCDNYDCSPTVYREIGNTFEFLTRENHWVRIPRERITFLPIPGDPATNEEHHAHLCYSSPEKDYAWAKPDGEDFFLSEDGIETIDLYCAFIPPGGA